jgi:hypothetical protein
MHYAVIFDVASKPLPWRQFGLLLFATVLLVILGHRRLSSVTGSERRNAIAVIRTLVVFLVILQAGLAWKYEADRQRMIRDLARGDVSVIEGVVSHVEPGGLHRQTCFTVGDESLCYYWRSTTPALTSPATAICPGLRVRVSYQGRQILRLEVAADARDGRTVMREGLRCELTGDDS